ncbi:hypothetical protein MNB_SV-14-1552 [hydrothermal vent metagenome]|uniref:Uncharacterized protein n=1 Tax=hydrothermal vent metagenome TaxID=652676 RepID=A0A1W1CLS8_9ZZZZ
MNKTIKTIACGIILALATTQSVTATEEKKVTIEEMELNLATLAKEISEEKVKLYQKEALLNDMKLALLKEKNSKK